MEICEILATLNINTTRIYERKLRGFDIFSFYIRGINNLLYFKRKIGFSDINKNKKLENMIANPSRRSRPHRETREEIIDILKLKESSILDIVKKIKRSYSTTSLILNRLKNEHLISNRIKNKAFMWYLR